MTTKRSTSQRTGWLLGGLLGMAALGLGLALLPSGERRGARSGTREEGVARGAREPARLADAPAVDLEAPAEPGRAPEGERASVVSAPAPSASAARTCEVLVVHAASAAPAAGASVWVRPFAGHFDPLALESLEEATTPVVTDGRGRARLPVLAEKLLVLARLGASFGAGPIEVDSGTPARIELHPDWDVTVEVRHADGSAAGGVPVALAVPPGSRWAGHSKTTDPEGRARYTHVGLQMALAHEREGEVRVQRALDAPLVRGIDAEHPPQAPLVLVLPPCAAVRVRVLDPEGAPVADGTRVSLAHLAPGSERDVSPFAREERGSLEAWTSAGSALFECVELGGEIELGVHSTGATTLLREFRPAPLVASAREEHVLRLGLDHPVLEFRVLDPAGAVLAEEELALVLAERSGWIRDGEESAARTDSAGRFRLDLVGVLAEGGTRTLTVEARQGAIGTRLDLSQPFEPGLQPMGELRLQPAPLVVSGRVVEGAGTGVAGATVHVHLAVRDEDGTAIWYWQELDHAPTSAADGTFELRDFLAETELRLQAVADGQRSETVATQAGAHGVELRLQRAGSLRGSVRLEAGVPLDGFTLRVLPSGDVDSSPERRNGRLAPEGRFAFEGLVPGSYDLSLGVRGKDDLVRLEGVLVPSGGPSLDPRLEIDLRGRLSRARIVLLSEEPAEELHGDLRYGAPGEPARRWTYHWFDHSPIDVLSLLPSFDATLHVQGYRTVHLSGVSGTHEVHLEPALSVRLRLPPDVALPEPPLHVKAALAPEGDDSALHWGGPAFDERREIPCLAPQPGRLRVRWILERRGNGGASATTLDGLPEQFVDLSEGSEGTVFLLEVEDAALREAIAASGV